MENLSAQLRVYNSFSSMGSDHRVVTSKIKLNLRTSKAVSIRVNYECASLKNSDLSDFFTVTVIHKFVC